MASIGQPGKYLFRKLAVFETSGRGIRKTEIGRVLLLDFCYFFLISKKVKVLSPAANDCIVANKLFFFICSGAIG
jgi:hypothetical protein